MDHSNVNVEDIGGKGNLNCWGLAQEFSEEKNLSILPRDHSCDILVMNVAAFCPCLKSLSEVKVRRFINFIDKENFKAASYEESILQMEQAEKQKQKQTTNYMVQNQIIDIKWN